MSSDYERTTIDTADDRGRLRRAWDTLQDTVTQPVATVTRNATLTQTGGDVEDIDPPDDIDELIDLSEDVGFIRKNLNEYVSDVHSPGVRVEADDDTTVAYFMGGDDAPDRAPEGGFLAECFVDDQKRQPLAVGAKRTTKEKWRRGTVLIEKLYEDDEDPESIITGFTHVRPETVSARTYEHTNQLVAPDDTEAADMVTDRDEAAAFVQFDENSILGRRGRFGSREAIPLSQNDVCKQTLDQDIGGDDPEDGVFGVSILRSVRDPAEEYLSIARDEAEAIKRIAFGLYTVQFNDHVIEAGDQQILVEWDDDDIQAAETTIDDLDPGEALTTDAKIEMERFQPDLPDLAGPQRRRARAIVDPLPAPFYKHAFADEINQFVTEDQRADYQDLIREERNAQAAFWTDALRDVAERHPDLDPSGLQVHIEPEADASPVMSLDVETIEKIQMLAGALNDLVGQGESPAAVFGPDVVRELVAHLPEDAATQDALSDGSLDEADAEVQAQFERLLND